MPYTIKNDPYINRQTGIFRNLLGIDQKLALENAEAQITSVEISALLIDNSSVVVDFDSNLLCKIHKQLFSEIYDWAGKYRTIDMEKDDTRFAHTPHITSQLKQLLSELSDENYLIGLNKQNFINRLAHYYSELNIIHPFREGNGRTLRTFISLLTVNANWDIAWDIMDSKENIKSCIAGYMGDEKPLNTMLNKIIK